MPKLLTLLTLIFLSSISLANQRIDLSNAQWNQGRAFALNGNWTIYPGRLITPDQADLFAESAETYPVPEVWGDKSLAKNPPPALGVVTYAINIQLPETRQRYYLYLPDMPSAYRLWVNGEARAQQGQVGLTPDQERAAFKPKTIDLGLQSHEIELFLQLSNFHYREGGVWFSPEITDESGYFSLAIAPSIEAAFFAALLLAIGLYNCSLFIFRRQEKPALYFGLLCLVVGVRRLLIDERVLYSFAPVSWENLQRLEHLCFYLSLPLFIGFFTHMYNKHVPAWPARAAWIATLPFIVVCSSFPTRVYTEFNVTFQGIILLGLSYCVVMFIKTVMEGGQNVKTFGFSLLILVATVVHDVLKANDILFGDNIAHFGLLAFVISISISMQRRYLNSMAMVESMSEQLKLHNTELKQLDEFKDEFLATTSHELRTPLQGISGLAQQLQQSSEHLSQEQQNKINLIANTSERLRVLVNDILDVSSIKHGKLQLNWSSVDLKQITELVFGPLQSMLADKPVKLSAEIDSDCRYLRADAFRLQQVLFNLLGNAAKFTDYGEIKLHAHFADDQLIIDIQDTGSGIPKDKQAQLFTPYELAANTADRRPQSSGLGLSISLKLVELHGGYLDIESEPGQGTRVSIHLPVNLLLNVPLAEQAPKSDTIELSPPLSNAEHIGHKVSGAQTVIYICDDEAINRELLASVLSSELYHVELFVSGVDLLKALRDKQPDLILLDYMMPGMQGVEVCHALRQQYNPLELPVMMVTAQHQLKDIVASLAAGANDYLTKPYQNPELLARVKNLLHTRQHWLTSKENVALRSEILRREKLEAELEENNILLLQTLDLSPELIVQFNSEGQIHYCNESAREKLQPRDCMLAGMMLDDIFDPASQQQVSTYISEESYQKKALSLSTREGITFEAQLSRVEVDAQPLFILLAHEPTDNQTSLEQLREALSINKKRMEEIELSLLHGLKSEQSLSERHAPARDGTAESSEVAREKLAELMRFTLDLWELHTEQSKIELAEMSRCWRVYIDGTSIKTRTLDRYLSAKTLPENPRWRSVVRTSHFVLKHCTLPEDQIKNCQAMISEIERLYT